jgi:hypothetical protein
VRSDHELEVGSERIAKTECPVRAVFEVVVSVRVCPGREADCTEVMNAVTVTPADRSSYCSCSSQQSQSDPDADRQREAVRALRGAENARDAQ